MEYSNYRVSNSIPPTREEIRDALMKECASYSTGLSEACQAAVYIAYYLG